MLQTKRTCPKCNGLARLCAEGDVVVLKCFLCGFIKFVEEYRDGMVIYRSEKPTNETLPRRGTKLHKCLSRMGAYETVTTAFVSELLGQSTSDTSSQLAVLKSKGLVDQLNSNRGVSGGSSWQMSAAARKLLYK